MKNVQRNGGRGVTVLMVSVYILCCIVIRTRPCKVFQLNARFFDSNAGIFSKMAIDQLLPTEWRLMQRYDDGAMPDTFPVFVKPEWSQNARGVHRADNADALHRIRQQIAAQDDNIRYLIQHAAPEKNEYEIFFVHNSREQKPAVLTVTHARNDAEALPVNGVYNRNTRYVEITDSFNAAQLHSIWQTVKRIGEQSGVPNISRVSVRANSPDDLLRGAFHIIEVNLFLPMPINLLDPRYTPMKTFRFVLNCMFHLARATKHRDRSTPARPVFIKSMLYNRRNPLLNFWRNRI